MKLLTNLSSALLLAAILLFNCCKKENLTPITLHKSEAANAINTATASDSSHIYSADKVQFLMGAEGLLLPLNFHRQNTFIFSKIKTKNKKL